MNEKCEFCGRTTTQNIRTDIGVPICSKCATRYRKCIECGVVITDSVHSSFPAYTPQDICEKCTQHYYE